MASKAIAGKVNRSRHRGWPRRFPIAAALVAAMTTMVVMMVSAPASAAVHDFPSGISCGSGASPNLSSLAVTSSGWTEAGVPPGQVRHGFTRGGTTWVQAWNQPGASVLQVRATWDSPHTTWTWARVRAEHISDAMLFCLA
jgi:hypothetical protein